MRKITVEPEQLEACAMRMNERNQDYLRDSDAFFQTVDNMSAAWKGKDNLAFTNRISRFQTDFRQMSVLCSQYAEFLKNSARAYRQTQDELVSQVNRLGE